MDTFSPPGDCPVCGEFVPAGDTSCKSCGSCPETGWNEETAYDGLDLPDSGDSAEAPAKKERPLWVRLTMAAALLLLAIVLFVLTNP